MSLSAIRAIQKLNDQELEAGVSIQGSWHNDYNDSAYIHIGGLPYGLTEGDIVTIFSQYGNPVHVRLLRDKESGKSKGSAFLKYADQRSTVLAVDNLNGATILGRMIKVDHTRYEAKEGEEELESAMNSVIGASPDVAAINSKEDVEEEDQREERTRSRHSSGRRSREHRSRERHRKEGSRDRDDSQRDRRYHDGRDRDRHRREDRSRERQDRHKREDNSREREDRHKREDRSRERPGRHRREDRSRERRDRHRRHERSRERPGHSDSKRSRHSRSKESARRDRSRSPRPTTTDQPEIEDPMKSYFEQRTTNQTEEIEDPMKDYLERKRHK
uniref:ARAD1B07942p n=1 Tax=Blastobotrys adeninivorans TaxID=409370 RepID=A0A060T634_BLAAD